LSGILTEVGGVDADLTIEKGAGLAVRGSVDGVSSRFKLVDLKGRALASAAALSYSSRYSATGVLGRVIVPAR